ncbi:MAG: ATP-binding protein [Tissierellia bacterium]|nr:ATP-binding protein [Tissierellia bacterium]
MNERKEANRILAQYRKENEEKFQRKRNRMKKEIPEYFQKEKLKKSLGIAFIRESMEQGNPEAILQKIKTIDDEMMEILSSQGYEKKDLEKEYHCNLCKDEGHVLGKICSCKRRLELEILYRHSRLEERLKEENFETFDLNLFSDDDSFSIREHMGIYYDRLKKYAEEFHRNSPSILFTGPVGTGKTFFCSSIAKKVMEKGHSVLYKTASELMKDLWDYYYAPFDDKENMVKQYRMIQDSELLIIDDLGTENITDTSLSHLFNLLNERMVQNQPTIISTNLRLTDIESYYDGRIYSRIIGNYDIFIFRGEDLRRKKRGL